MHSSRRPFAVLRSILRPKHVQVEHWQSVLSHGSIDTSLGSTLVAI